MDKVQGTCASARPLNCGVMRTSRAFLFVCAGLVQACSSQPVTPMAACYEGAFPETIAPGVLRGALVKATAWSNKTYGDDCLVCAELYHDDGDRFTIHITSPANLLLDTSAEMTFDKRSGDVLGAGIYHSCHLRVVRKEESH
jgi:hypothetical protein